MHKPPASNLAAFAIAVLFSAFAQTAAAAIPQIERDALIALYNSTNGPGWTNKANWNGVAGTECTWYRVTCDDGQTTVTSLDLSWNRLSGSMPAALGNLSNLRNLDLGSNQLSGSIPAALGNLTSLQVLRLSANQLNGSIPTELGNLSSLQDLDLQVNQLIWSIPAELGNLSNLRDLNLGSNQLSGSIPAALGKLSSLQFLGLFYNQLSGSIPAALGNLSSLRDLWLDVNQLSGSIPAALGNLSNLESLWLEHNQLSGSIPAELGKLSSLQHLNLGSNQLSGPVPAELGNLSNLWELDLGWNQLLSGPIPAELGNLSNLRELDLAPNQLSGPIPAKLGNLSNLQTLVLFGNQLSGSIPAELGNLSSLRDLDLSSNQLSGSIPEELGNLSSLQYLSLSGNRLSGSIPAELGNLSGLGSLRLSGNQLSGELPPGLANLNAVTVLYLSHNALFAVDPGVTAWANARQTAWASTQTVAPASVAVPSVTTATATLSWTPIMYTGNTGRYEVWADAGGGAALAGSTSNKSATGLTVTGLSGGTTYTFSVRTVTYPHGSNANTVTSDFSAGVIAATSPAAPSISIDDVTVTEGNAGTTHASFTVSLSAPSASTVTVQYATANGTATAGADYTAVPLTTLTFVPGDTSETATVLVSGDLVGEGFETFYVNLSNPSNATISDNQGVGTITDDAAATIAIDDISMTEGNAGTTNATFTVSLSARSASTVTVQYATANGTATAGADYKAVPPTTLTFTPGDNSATATVLVSGDLVDEANETFYVNLTNPTNATIADAQGVGTIIDDDGTPQIAVSNVTVTEKNTGSVAASFTVSLSGTSSSPVRMQWSTADNTATADTDYTAVLPTTLTIDPGQPSKSVTVMVRGDTIDEIDETFYVNLTNATNATIADAQGIGTITDDDSAQVSVRDTSVAEGDSGTTSAALDVLLTNASVSTVTVQWATADGTAAAGVDYISGGPSTVTFAPGETAKTVIVEAIGDTEVEGNESFYVNLSAPANATIADGQGEVTIVDDDEAAPVVPDPAIVVEGCERVGAACTLSARSLSNGNTASWTYQWKLDGVVESTIAVWKPSFAQPGIHGVSLRVTNAAGIGEATTTLLVVPATCPSDALCTLGGRFQLTLAARDHRTGNTGPGLPLQSNDLFGYFALPALTSNPENPEVFVKMLDGRVVNGNFWVFYGGLTDLEYTLTVKDTVAGTTKSYFKPGGSSQGGFDIGSGVTAETCPKGVKGAVQPPATPGTCEAGTDRLCLNAARFRVELTARDQRTGNTGPGLSIPQNDLFGYFALPALTSTAENPEVFVKVIDGRVVNGFFWVFYGGLTDLEYTMTVTDTITGVRKSYTKVPGSACGAFDVSAF